MPLTSAIVRSVRAVARGRELGKNWRLWIAGDGPERRNLESLAGELGVADRVQLLGFRDDIGELLAADLSSTPLTLTFAEMFRSATRNPV